MKTNKDSSTEIVSGLVPGQAVLLHDIPAQQAMAQPEASALSWRGEDISYQLLQQRIQHTARRLASAGNSGDRLAVLSWNSAAYIELIYAASAAGKLLVPLNARLAPAEWSDQLQRSGATTLFVQPELWQTLKCCEPDLKGVEIIILPPESDNQLNCEQAYEDQGGHAQCYRDWLQADALGELPNVDRENPVWLLFTSGSTGKPKGALLNHRSFFAGLASAALCRPVQNSDRYYYPFPLFHVAAHNVLLQHLYGACVVLARAFDATETLAACRAGAVTSMSLAPTMVALLFEEPTFNPRDLARVRSIGYGAAAMPLPLLQRLMKETRIELCQSYGMTELSGSVAFLTAEDHRMAATTRPELLKSVGRPLPTATLRVVNARGEPTATGESGEIVVRAPQCMLGYWQDAQASAETLIDGWLHTGDVGRFDAQGYLYLVDRKKDMILSGGENVASREVEAVLQQHPKVRDCAVIGLPDVRWGERVTAVLVLAQSATDDELTAFCRERLAGYKTPKRWHRCDALPVNAGGKVDKPLLRQCYAGGDAHLL